ncbi:MAG: large conductance mechanosensitive channel protein MscL [Verrucomicrobia bacterium]|nr:large conductance mechanosensitive channel protein MscL [Verrucomicrobiota bacterium]
MKSSSNTTLDRVHSGARTWLREFRAFMKRGSLIDLAVGVMIGGALGKIVSSFVADVLTPPLGLLIGEVHFSALKVRLGGTAAAPVTLNYGNFLQSLFDFVIVAAVLSTTISATLGVTSLGLGGVMPWDQFAQNWRTWWFGDALGALVMAPVLLTWSRRAPVPARPFIVFEAIALALVLMAVSQFAFTRGLGFRFLVFPPLIWAALRFGPRGATLGMFAAAIIAVWHTVHDVSPFAGLAITERLHYVQIFAGVTSVTMLILAAVKREREGARDQILQHRDQLETQVLARTAELETSRAELQDFLDNASDLIQSVDVEGRYRFVNRAWCETLGYAPAEVAGLTMFDVIAPGQHAHCGAAFQRLLATREAQRIETEFRRKDGRSVIVEGHVNVRLKEGRPATTRGVFRDITERRRAEEELRASRTRWQLAVTASRDGIWDWNMVTREVYASPHAKELIGFSDAELSNDFETWTQLVHPEDRPKVAGALKQHLRRATPIFECEHRMRAKDGSYRWILSRGASLFDERGKPQRMLGAFIDITERRHTEEQMITNLAREKELNELKSHFVSMASHELRTPLAAMSLGVDFLMAHRRKLTDDDIEKTLATTRDGVRQLRAILDNLLLLGRAEDLKIHCVPVSADVPELLRKLADEARNVDKHSHAIDVSCAPTAWRAPLDPQLVRHVVLNLLSNACKYSPAGGPVQLAATVRGQQLEFTVTDRGIGIPAEDQSRLFTFFFRARNVSDIPGSGLGLLVVRHCLEAHGGTIAFTSALGEGTRFTVTLPLTPVSA